MTFKNFKNLLLFFASLIYFYYALKDQSFLDLYNIIHEIDYLIILIVFLSSLGLYITSLRLKFCLKFFEINASFFLISKINIFGQLLGSVFNNLIGSIFGRGVIAKEFNFFPKIFPFITLYEKLLMLFSMLVINFFFFFIILNIGKNLI